MLRMCAMEKTLTVSSGASPAGSYSASPWIRRVTNLVATWRGELLGLLLISGLALMLRWPIAAIPLERDEGEYAYIAQRWLAGEVPYKGSFDQKPPGVFAA